jgi:hypothetical protein
MCDILCQKGVMLWEPASRQYLVAHEREKQLLFFLLAFVAQVGGSVNFSDIHIA